MRRSGRFVHLEDLVGRMVVGEDGRRVGRIEEVRVKRHDGDYEVSEFLLGDGAFFERHALVHRLLGGEPRIYVAEWNQIDITNPDRPRLTCPAEELKVKR